MADAVASRVPWDINAYVLAQPNPPGVQILPPEVEFDLTMQRGYDTWRFTVQGFIALTSDIGAQQLLDELIEPAGGMKATLEADNTLGGLVASLRVESSGPPRQVEAAAGHPMLLVEWRVSMFVRGS